MPTQSSPVITSPTISSSTLATKLTYTTAGTPYNPNTSQPLQPPTRRGRSLKYSPGGAYTSLSLLPKSILASLPISMGMRKTSAHQYSSLQQNEDRAVNPMGDSEHLCINMSAQVPRISASVTPSPLTSLFSGLAPGKHEDGEDQESEKSETGSDLGSDPLLNMTVKSLQNLASYPNPNQKKAQKALLRGVKPALANRSTAAYSPSVSAPSIYPISPRDSTKNEVISPIALRPSPVAVERLQDEALWKSEAGLSTPQMMEFPFHDTVAENNFVPAQTATVSAGLGPALGSGAPLPLTAGPPGQRQYRPSTFESTFKALQAKAQAQNGVKIDEEDVLSVAQQTPLYASFDDASTMSDSPSSAFQFSTSISPDSRIYASNNTTMTIGDDSSELAEDDIKYTAVHGWKQDSVFVESLSSSDWTPRPSAASMCRPAINKADPVRFVLGFEFQTEEQLAARKAHVERTWYAGADFLANCGDESTLKLPGSKRAWKAQFGAIGEGRPQPSQPQYKPIKVSEANQMTIEEHARPLVNMAFVAVQRYIDGQSKK